MNMNKQIDKEELRECLESSKNNHSLCMLNGYPFIGLLDIAMDTLDGKTSVVGERVVVKTNYFNSSIAICSDKNYRGDIAFDFEITGESSQQIIYDHFSIDLKEVVSTFDLSEAFMKIIILIALSGTYSIPHDYYELLTSAIDVGIYKRTKAEIYSCEKCGVVFLTPDDFIRHLDDTGHYDGIFDRYPHYEPLREIKRKWGFV